MDRCEDLPGHRLRVAAPRWAGPYGAAPFLEQHAISIVQPDVAFCGGITAAKRIATVAEPHGISVAFHNPLGPLPLGAGRGAKRRLPVLAKRLMRVIVVEKLLVRAL